MKIQYGCSRFVLLIGKYAVKLPQLSYTHQSFLTGCKDNWTERLLYKLWKDPNNLVHSKHKSLAPSIFCSWFGLIQIQKRVIPLDRELTRKERKYFRPICGRDNKKENFGIYQERLVCVDYP